MSELREGVLRWLDDQERLCATATRGPWTHGMPDESVHEISGPGDEYDHVLWAGVCKACQKRNGRCTSGDDKDYDFICASRTVLPLALAALRAEVERHSRFGIYEECGHDHSDEEKADLTCEIEGVGWVCEEGLIQAICRECDTDDGVSCENSDVGLWPCAFIDRIHAATVGVS